VVEVLFWPALLGYGEAALAYASPRFSRLGTWGVRVGWLAQTALLVAQAVSSDGFPWSTWAGSLNLFVWLLVGAYLIWGCRPRYRLLGLTVMPLAVALFVAARIGGGTEDVSSSYGSLFLLLHVGLVLAAFAGFTLAAALSALYLLEERQLKRRTASILRLRMPSLVVLERVIAKTILVSWPLLTLGLAAGLVRLGEDGGDPDAAMSVAVLTWLVYGGFLALRLRGQRAAYVALCGFALVIVVRIALAGTHFA
jgi:ABC-type uncharacterized transport system permease subunit